MGIENIILCFTKLRHYCERKDYKGWDVGDSIESKFLTKTILGKLAIVRFLFIQLTGHRLAYFNVRHMLIVPKMHNPKGIALFLNGYCNLYDLAATGKDINIGMEECLEKTRYLADLLLSLQSKGYHGACWGYPTGWQMRLSSYLPPYTPTVVATSFAVEALFHAYDITGDERYKETALSSAEFVVKDLKRTPGKSGVILSYSPFKGNEQVFNASLLGARILVQCYKYSSNASYLDLAGQCIRACVNEQNDDGSWVYGKGPSQGWIDNFHTGYNLEALRAYEDMSGDMSFHDSMEKGLQFMVDNHFEKDYTPKYYHNKRYPIDIHCCGEIFVVLNKLGVFEPYEALAKGVMAWTLENMQDKNEGYFYFQKRKWITNKTPLMRWSQAFMFNAMTYYLKSVFNTK